MSSGYTASYIEVKDDGSIKQVVASDSGSRSSLSIDLDSGRYKEYARLESGGQLKEIYVQDKESGSVYKIDVVGTSQISRSYSSPSSSSFSSHSSASRSSSSSSGPSYQYNFSSKELQGNKEFWDIYNNYAIRAVDEKIKNDPGFRKALAESGDYAFARSQAILLTAINKYKTGEDGVILAPKERRGSYLSDAEISRIIYKERQNNLNSSNDSVQSSNLNQESSFSKVKKIADSALAARYAFSQISNPVASNIDGSVTYLLGDQTVRVKDVKTEYVGKIDDKYVYKQTLKAEDGKQYLVELKLDSSLERAGYTIKENRLPVSSNAFVLYSQELNYTPYNPVVNNYEKRNDDLSPVAGFEKAAKEGFRKIGISNIPIVGDVFNFSTEVFSRGVIGSAYELVNPSGGVGEKAKAIGQSGLGFVVSLPFRAAAGGANLFIVNPLESFKEYGKSGIEKISRSDYLGGAIDAGIGLGVAGLTILPITRGAAAALKGSGFNIVKGVGASSSNAAWGRALERDARAIEKLERKIYGNDYVYIKTSSIENNAVKSTLKEAGEKKGGVLDKIDIPGSIGLSVITDPMVAGAAFNAAKSIFPAFVPAVAVRGSVSKSASSFTDDFIKAASVPKYRYVYPGMFSEKESFSESNFFVIRPYKEKGVAIGDIKNSKNGLLVIKERRNINELSILENKNTLMIKEGFGKENIEPWPFEIGNRIKSENKSKNKTENEYPWVVNDRNIIVTKEKNKNRFEEENRFKFGGGYKEKYGDGSIFGRKSNYREENIFEFKERYGNKEGYKNKTKNPFEEEYMYGYREQYVKGTKTKNKSGPGKVKIPIPNLDLPNFNFLERPGRKKFFALGFSKLEFIK